MNELFNRSIGDLQLAEMGTNKIPDGLQLRFNGPENEFSGKPNYSCTLPRHLVADAEELCRQYREKKKIKSHAEMRAWTDQVTGIYNGLDPNEKAVIREVHLQNDDPQGKFKTIETKHFESLHEKGALFFIPGDGGGVKQKPPLNNDPMNYSLTELGIALWERIDGEKDKPKESSS